MRKIKLTFLMVSFFCSGLSFSEERSFYRTLRIKPTDLVEFQRFDRGFFRSRGDSDSDSRCASEARDNARLDTVAFFQVDRVKLITKKGDFDFYTLVSGGCSAPSVVSPHPPLPDRKYSSLGFKDSDLIELKEHAINYEQEIVSKTCDKAELSCKTKYRTFCQVYDLVLSIDEQDAPVGYQWLSRRIPCPTL